MHRQKYRATTNPELPRAKRIERSRGPETHLDDSGLDKCTGIARHRNQLRVKLAGGKEGGFGHTR